MQHYLFCVSMAYAFPVLRPLQEVLRGRGDAVAWFFDDPALVPFARPDETVLRSVDEVIAFDPAAVFSANKTVYDFFPGVKVQLFYGFCIGGEPQTDPHFDINGLFDLYCTHGPTSTPYFEKLAARMGHFAVAETGWPKTDNFFPGGLNASHMLKSGERPTILYSSTFARGITSTPYLYYAIEDLVSSRPWDWIITLHPNTDPAVVALYRNLAACYPNAVFYSGDDNTAILRRADVMVCDSSSIIVEFMTMGKPVVTFRNNNPGPHLIDISDAEKLGPSIERALRRPWELMEAVSAYAATMNPHLDGRCSQRVAQAVDDFIGRGGRASLPSPKPRNILLRWRLRRKLGYYKGLF